MVCRQHSRNWKYMSHLVFTHLTLLQENLNFYFLVSEKDKIISNMWMLNFITDEITDRYDASLWRFVVDNSQKTVSRYLVLPSVFVVTLINIPE